MPVRTAMRIPRRMEMSIPPVDSMYIVRLLYAIYIDFTSCKATGIVAGSGPASRLRLRERSRFAQPGTLARTGTQARTPREAPLVQADLGQYEQDSRHAGRDAGTVPFRRPAVCRSYCRRSTSPPRGPGGFPCRLAPRPRPGRKPPAQRPRNRSLRNRRRRSAKRAARDCRDTLLSVSLA